MTNPESYIIGKWIRGLAAWAYGPTASMAGDPPVAALARRRAIAEVETRIQNTADEAGAEILGPIHFTTTTDRISSAEIVLGEVVAIVLRNPNPFPEIVIFGRRRLASTLAGLAR